MANKLLSFLLVFVVLIGLFTFKLSNYDFSLEGYLTEISALEERPPFPKFKLTLTDKLSDYIDSLTEEDNTETKLLTKIFNAIYELVLRIGFIFTLLFDIGYWVINICIYLVRLIVWFVKALSVIFINPSLSVDKNYYSKW